MINRMFVQRHNNRFIQDNKDNQSDPQKSVGYTDLHPFDEQQIAWYPRQQHKNQGSNHEK
ncbi:hypothetical protein [Paenibacillus sp. 453mf]|uniref:hypothetical protein n=1 Tax=Paenibacillus sp. 453mf TaxID=1761874 RepID=UPI001113C6ED|nr:hypothetical protein [Paenibacillus sp. 453mf]